MDALEGCRRLNSTPGEACDHPFIPYVCNQTATVSFEY